MNPSNQLSEPTLDPASVHFRSIVKSLEIMIRTEPDAQKKSTINRTLQKFKEMRRNSPIKDLNIQSQKKLMQIRAMIKIYRDAFTKITDQMPQYREFKLPQAKITQILLDIQQKIDPKDYRANYVRALTLKKKEFGWTKQFIQDWTRGTEQTRKAEQERHRQKQSQKNKLMKSQPPQIPPSQSQSQVRTPPVPIQSIKNQQKSEVSKNQKSQQKLPGQKPEKKVKKDDTGAQKPEKQKKPPKPKKQAEQSESDSNEAAKEATRKKIEKQQRQRLQQRYEKPREPKNRVKSLMEYLQNRRQFSSIASNQSKLKEIAQFLNQNLQKFMKHHLFNLIEIAKLRNRKHQTLLSSGNQFTYFSKQGYTALKPVTHLQVSQQPARMLKLNYRSKFQLYNLLRSREQNIEQALLKQFSTKKDQQASNKSDKKLWQYLLRPNQMIEKTQNYVEMEENKTDRLSIEITHIRYLFQSHKFIRQSWLMMYCYNS